MKDFKVYQASGMLNFLVSEASDVRKKEQTLSGDIVSFSADAESPMKIVVDIDSTGWTGCEVARTGKNSFDGVFQQGTFDNIGSEIASNTRIRTGFISVVGGQAYTISNFSGGSTTLHEGYVYDKDKNFIEKILGSSMQSFYYTFANNVAFVRISVRNSDNSVILPNVGKLQIELGASATDYEPYFGTTRSVTFPVEAGTVTDGTLTIDYDGSVTLQTGGQTYTLTSVSPIETLIGDNNIWADAGPVSVTYPI